MKSFRVKITFLTKEQGGRNLPPYSLDRNTYRCQSKIVSDVNSYGSWTMAFQWDVADDKPDVYVKNATAMYITGAPYEELMQLRKFELYEGSKLVATGEVLDD